MERYRDYLQTKRLINRLKPYSHSFNIFVGIPVSQLYTHILENNLYEHIDDIGLVYLPGYDIKTRFFYNLDSRNLVNHVFGKRTAFDKSLLRAQFVKDTRRNFIMVKNRLNKLIPVGVKNA